jgi:hypothetical protein
MSVPSFLNLHEVEALAREHLPPATWDYFAGGAEDEITLHANRKAFEQLELRYRVLVDMSPLLQWSLALIAGGGTAGVFQSTTSVVRMASTATTGGLANPVISTVEAVVAVVLSALSVLMPILAVCLVALGLVLLVRFVRRFRRQPQASVAAPADSASAAATSGRAPASN